MTVQSTVARADYQGNNVTTLFTVPFYFLDNSHVKVVRTDNTTVPPTVATLVLGSDYVLTGAGVQIGGQIQTTVAPTAAQVLTILRNVPFTQLIHYVPNDPFPAATHEQALDQLTMEVQALNEVTTHALQFPTYEPSPTTVSPAATRAKTMLGFDANGNVTYLPIPASVGAGDLRTDVFAAGTNFTPNVTTTLTLSRAPNSTGNLEVHFDGVYQGPDQYSVTGAVVTFTSAIPLGTQKVYATSGTTLSVFVPPDLAGTDALRYTNASGQSFANNVEAKVTGWTRVIDRLAANFNASTGVFTAPAAGYYQVSGSVAFAPAMPIGTPVTAFINVNGAHVAQGVLYVANATNPTPQTWVHACIKLLAGDQLAMNTNQASGFSAALDTSGLTNSLSISRICPL